MADGDGETRPLEDAIGDLARRVDALSRRLERLEDAVGGARVEPEAEAPTEVEPPPLVVDPASEQPAPAGPSREARIEALARLKQRPEVVARPAPPRRERVEVPKFDFSRLEWLLGARGLALAGVLIVVVGIVMFLKLAYDQGWIARIAPSVRCMAAGGFGLLLVGVGEVLRRRVNALASSGTTAAGIAVMYAAVFAAARMFELIDTPTAFGLMGLVTVVGIALGSLSNRVMLALLSLVGAFAVPVLLASGEPSYVVLPAYLLALLVMGLVLAGWRGGHYAHVRRLAWWGTALVGSLWLASVYDEATASALVFVSCVWVLTVAELIASARFFGVIRDRADWPQGSRAGFVVSGSGEVVFDPAALFEPEARWINAAFGVTVWSVVSAALTIRAVRPELDYLAPLGFAVASVLAAVVALRLKRGDGTRLWSPDSSPRSALAAAMTVNAALLVVATIATALGGWVQVVAWAMVGLAAVETGRRLRFRAAGVFGFGMLTVALGRLFSIDLVTHLDSGAPWRFIGLAFTAWSPQVVMVAATWAAASWRSRYSPERAGAACVAMWLAAASLVHLDGSPDAIGPALLVLAAVVGWVTAVVPVGGLRINAVVLAGVGMVVALAGQERWLVGGDEAEWNWLAMAVGALAWSALAALPRMPFAGRAWLAGLAVASGCVALWSGAELTNDTAGLIGGALFAAALVAAGVRLYRWSLVELAAVPVGLVAIGWGAQQIDLGEAALVMTPVANTGFLVAMLATAAAMVGGVLLGRLRSAEDAPPGLATFRGNLRVNLFGLAWLVLLACSSLEAVRVARLQFAEGTGDGAALSIWWSLFAIASVVAGFRLSAILRWAGLGLLGVVAVKVLLFDTVTLSPVARVTAAIVVGLVIIAAGVLYARLVDRGGSDTAEPDFVDDDEG